MTYEEAAAVKTLTREEIGQLWSAYYGIIPNTEVDDGIATPWRRTMLEALIKTAPLSYRRALVNVEGNEFTGFFPWKDERDNDRLVQIAIADNDETCMCDAEVSDWSWYLSSKID
jgi:hypothetical protein